MAYCFKCGFLVGDDWRFCSQCGASVCNPNKMDNPPILVRMGGRVFFEPAEHRVYSPYYNGPREPDSEFLNRKPPKKAPPPRMGPPKH
jgi:hypothetical protein